MDDYDSHTMIQHCIVLQGYGHIVWDMEGSTIHQHQSKVHILITFVDKPS